MLEIFGWNGVQIMCSGQIEPKMNTNKHGYGGRWNLGSSAFGYVRLAGSAAGDRPPAGRQILGARSFGLPRGGRHWRRQTGHGHEKSGAHATGHRPAATAKNRRGFILRANRRLECRRPDGGGVDQRTQPIGLQRVHLPGIGFAGDSGGGEQALAVANENDGWASPSRWRNSFSR
jgi:hypothetical protein